MTPRDQTAPFGGPIHDLAISLLRLKSLQIKH
jgi:hypothetical protein